MKETSEQKLHELENEGKYVFHGSGLLIEEFDPRQAHNYIDGKQIPDGDPAIFTSTFADYAIFMALINEINCPLGYHSGSGFRNGKPTFQATQSTLNQLQESAKGYVYVFNRSDFSERNESEWVSFKKIKPVSTITVIRPDFLPQIEVTDLNISDKEIITKD